MVSHIGQYITVSNSKLFKTIKQYILVTLGGILNGATLHIFINPLQLLPGGFSGIASLLYYLIPGSNMSLIYIIINIPLLILALIMIRGDFTFKTIWATVVCTVTLAVLPEQLVFVAEPLIGVFIGGFCIGMAMYLAHCGNGSNGGTEVIGKMVAIKRPELDISHSILLLNMSILVVGSIVMTAVAGQNPISIFYSAMFICTGGAVMGMLSRGFNHPQKLMIVTNNGQIISQEIVARTHRGTNIMCTCNGDGTERDKCIVMVLCQYRQCHLIKQLVAKYDKDAFVIIKDVHYVFSRPDFTRGYNYDKK